MGGRGSSSGGGNDPPVDPPVDPDNPQNWTLSQLQSYLNTTGDNATTIKSKTTDWINANKSQTTTRLQEHYMPSPQDFYAISSPGLPTILFPPDKASEAAKTIIALSKSYSTLPDALKSTLDKIVLTTKPGTDNVAGASGGGANGDIVVYDADLSVSMLAHELAHNLAKAKYGNITPPYNEEGTDGYYEDGSSDYGNAVNSSEPPVDAFRARDNPAEDFAQAVRMYVDNPAQLQRIAPLRYAVIHRLMTDPSYTG
jgi:hypothetical protein